MSKPDAGKGDTPRPMQISQQEYDVRWALAFKRITREEFDRRIKEMKSGQCASEKA